jgi:predicted RNase H-like HicB family nuclease
MLRYPARFKPAKEGGFVVTFRDIPEAITQGESVEDAMIHARDALETALDFYFDDRREVPAPSKRGFPHRFPGASRAARHRRWPLAAPPPTPRRT